MWNYLEKWERKIYYKKGRSFYNINVISGVFTILKAGHVSPIMYVFHFGLEYADYWCKWRWFYMQKIIFFDHLETFQPIFYLEHFIYLYLQ